MSSELLQAGTGPEGSFTCQLLIKPAESVHMTSARRQPNGRTVLEEHVVGQQQNGSSE